MSTTSDSVILRVLGRTALREKRKGFKDVQSGALVIRKDYESLRHVKNHMMNQLVL